MSNLSTLKQQVEEMQAEIERLEAEEREPEIPVGALCWFWDEGVDPILSQYSKVVNMPADIARRHMSTSGSVWSNSSIANDIPGVMVFQKHDGGPCPVDERVTVIQKHPNGMQVSLASIVAWQNVTAYAIINKAEWME